MDALQTRGILALYYRRHGRGQGQRESGKSIFYQSTASDRYVFDCRTDGFQLWLYVLVAADLYMYASSPLMACTVMYGKEYSIVALILDILLDAIYLVDILVSLNTVRAHWKDEAEVPCILCTRKSIFESYVFQGNFWIDFLGMISHPVLYAAGGSTWYLQPIRLGRLLRILRSWTSVTTVLRTSAKLETRVMLNKSAGFVSKLRMVLCLVVIFFSIHLLACGLIAVAAIEEQAFDLSTWVTNYHGDDPVTVLEMYTTAFYWSTMTLTTIGYGDVGLVTTAERGYGTFGMLTGAMMYAFFISILADELRVKLLNQRAEYEVQKDMQGIEDFVSHLQGIDVHEELLRAVKQVVVHRKRASGANRLYGKDGLLTLSPGLRKVISAYYADHILKRIRVFRDSNEQVSAAPVATPALTDRLRGRLSATPLGRPFLSKEARKNFWQASLADLPGGVETNPIEGASTGSPAPAAADESKRGDGALSPSSRSAGEESPVPFSYGDLQGQSFMKLTRVASGVADVDRAFRQYRTILASKMEVEVFAFGEKMVRESDANDSMYLVKAGRVMVTHTRFSDAPTMLIRTGRIAKAMSGTEQPKAKAPLRAEKSSLSLRATASLGPKEWITSMADTKESAVSFGEEVLLNHRARLPCLYSAKALTLVETFTIERAHIWRAIDELDQVAIPDNVEEQLLREQARLRLCRLARIYFIFRRVKKKEELLASEERLWKAVRRYHRTHAHHHYHSVSGKRKVYYGEEGVSVGTRTSGLLGHSMGRGFTARASRDMDGSALGGIGRRPSDGYTALVDMERHLSNGSADAERSSSAGSEAEPSSAAVLRLGRRLDDLCDRVGRIQELLEGRATHAPAGETAS